LLNIILHPEAFSHAKGYIVIPDLIGNPTLEKSYSDTVAYNDIPPEQPELPAERKEYD